MNKKIIKQLDALQNNTWESIHVFTKKKKIFKSPALIKAFWNSSISVLHFDSFSKELMFESYLLDYFKYVDESNFEFIKCFLKSTKATKNLLICMIKKSRAFEIENHWKSFQIFEKTKDTELRIFHKEISYIKSFESKWTNDAQAYIKLLQLFNYEEIVLQTIAYYERVKRNFHSNNNFERITSFRQSTSSILNEMLRLKSNQNLIKSTKKDIEDYTEFVLPPIWHSSEMNSRQEPYEVVDEVKGLFRKVYDFFSKKDDVNNIVNLYLAGHFDFKNIDGFSAELLSTKSFINYRKVLDKNTYDDNYFTGLLNCDTNAMESLKEIKHIYLKEIEMAVQSELLYFDFLELSNNLTIKVDLKKVLLFLKSFSLFLMPQRRQLLKNPSNGEVMVLTKDVPKEFLSYFNSNYIVYFTIEEFKENTKKYFKFSDDEIEEIITLLSFDLLELGKEKEQSIDTNPLLKVGNLVIWPSALLRDMRWDVVLHRLFTKTGKINHNKQSDDLEKKIKEWFINANFLADNSFKYSINGRNGEIDVLAFKENTLFIIELKNTYIIEDVLTTSKYSSSNFESKASEQLYYAKDYIEENFEAFKLNFKNNTGKEIDCLIDDLKIETLILSNSYVSDETLFNNKYYKLSMFELMIILTNSKYDMLHSKVGNMLYNIRFEIPVDFLTGKNNEPITENACNLWENQIECSVRDLLSAIKENKIYSHMTQYDKKYLNTNVNLDIYTE